MRGPSRSDDTMPTLAKEDVFRSAPSHDGTYFKVPKVIKGHEFQLFLRIFVNRTDSRVDIHALDGADLSIHQNEFVGLWAPQALANPH